MVPLHGTCLLEVRAASLGRQDSGGLILSHLPSAPVASRYSEPLSAQGSLGFCSARWPQIFLFATIACVTWLCLRVSRKTHSASPYLGSLIATVTVTRSASLPPTRLSVSSMRAKKARAVQISERCLPREPDSTLSDDGWRESARFLKICPFQMRQLGSAAIG